MRPDDVPEGRAGDAHAPAGDAGDPADAPAPSPRGVDLARAALDAARERNAAARRARGSARGRGTSDDGLARRLGRRRWSGPGPDAARDPQPLGKTLGSWLARSASGAEVAKARLFAGWADVVGADIAAHAQPSALLDGELTVVAESTAWATQLRLLAPGLVRSINAAVGHGTVSRVRVKGPTAPSWRFGNRHVSGRGPRDTYG